jgi:hypothetical protein
LVPAELSFKWGGKLAVIVFILFSVRLFFFFFCTLPIRYLPRI